MRIGSFDTDRRVLVVAEIGNNHEGSADVAAELVRAAAASGADAVKFQTFRTALFVDRGDAERYARMARFELSIDEFARLQALAHSLGLLFVSTPLDLESAKGLAGLVDAYKIASGDNDFYPLIDFVCATGKPLIVSSGVSALAHVRHVKEYVERRWPDGGVGPGLAVLHCVSSYPVPDEEANLAAIGVLERELGCTIGYSDHTLGIDTCLYAVAAGARIIEKHFTLDKAFSAFRDHALSADPAEMKRLTAQIPAVAALVGRREKVVQPSEAQAEALIRRTVVAGRDLSAGHVVSLEDLVWKRPVRGLRPGQEHLIVGRALVRDVPAGEPIVLADVEGGSECAG